MWGDIVPWSSLARVRVNLHRPMPASLEPQLWAILIGQWALAVSGIGPVA